MVRRSKKSATPVLEKSYTFLVSVSFQMQFTFNENEVQPATEGGKNDFDPKDMALKKLGHELKKYLSEYYPIEGVEVDADFDSLLGISKCKPIPKVARKVSRKPVNKQRRNL